MVEQFPAEDKELLARAAAWDQFRELSDCAPASLLKVAQRHGLEFATAVLYDRVLRHREHGAFFQRTRSRCESANVTGLVGIIPGAFYREHKNTGADGARVAAILHSMQCAVECVPVDSFGSLFRNAALITEWLLKHKHERVTLISLSKGSADLKIALALRNAVELFGHVHMWISLSGLPHGTPLVDWLRRQKLRRLGVRLLLWLRGQRYSVVEELRHDCSGPLALWPPLPPHLRIIHVIAFPLQRHLAHPWAARAYKRVAPLGPNDGGGFLLGEVANLPGIVFPVWGADHYLQPRWDATALLRGLIVEAMLPRAEVRHANQSAAHPINPPASKSRE